MNSKMILSLSGALAIASAWLPWVKIMGISANGFRGEMQGNPGLFFVVLGALILIMGMLGRKWSAVVAMLLALCVGALGFKYFNDARDLGATAGIGIYMMMAAAVLGVFGGIMAFSRKKTVVY